VKVLNELYSKIEAKTLRTSLKRAKTLKYRRCRAVFIEEELDELAQPKQYQWDLATNI